MRACRQHDMGNAVAQYVVGFERAVEIHFDIGGALQLRHAPVAHPRPACQTGQGGFVADPSAPACPLLGHNDFRAAFGHGAGRFQTGRSATNNEYFLGLVQPADLFRVPAFARFLADGRILRAA